MYLYVCLHYSCDRQFLAYAQRYITIPALIAALKVMLVLGDGTDEHREGSRVSLHFLLAFCLYFSAAVCLL